MKLPPTAQQIATLATCAYLSMYAADVDAAFVRLAPGETVTYNVDASSEQLDFSGIRATGFMHSTTIGAAFLGIWTGFDGSGVQTAGTPCFMNSSCMTSSTVAIPALVDGLFSVGFWNDPGWGIDVWVELTDVWLFYSDGRDDVHLTPLPAPEPGSSALVGAGLLGLAIAGRRRTFGAENRSSNTSGAC